MSNGLDALKSRVGRRDVPPPQHSAPAKSPTPVADVDPATPTVATTAQPPRKQKRPPAPPKTAPTIDLVRQTVYLDGPADDILEAVRAASRPRRIDANRSAVIRLALRRLAAELSPTEIVDEIESASRAVDSGKPGRRLI